VAKTVSDPLSNEIVIPQSLIDFDKQIIQSEDILDDISKVIEKPIMLFRIKEGRLKLYYLRAIGWNKTMLIGVEEINDQFEVIDYEIDPCIEKITELHLNFERLI
jgi:hypothetical protein